MVVSRFRVPPDQRAAFLAAAEPALTVLAEQAGCRAVSLGQSTDDADLLLVRSEWDGIGAYRRALSNFEVKVHTVPLLSLGLDEPSAYEVVWHRDPTGTTTAVSGLAADAGEVGLGAAAAPNVPPVS